MIGRSALQSMSLNRTKAATAAAFAAAAASFCLAARNTAIAAPPKAAPVAWEYCFVQSRGQIERNQQGRRTIVFGILVLLPGGRQLFHEPKKNSHKEALEILNRLGGSGWEVVSHAEAHSSFTWTLKRRKPSPSPR